MMGWDSLFQAANLFAVLLWAVLIFLPRRDWSMHALLLGGAGVLSLAYAVLIIGFWTGLIASGAGEGGMNLASIDSIQRAFSADGVLVLGWIHYLAFDFFVGMWIAKDADARGVSRFIQPIFLLATFLAGPLGLAAWLVLRGMLTKSGLDSDARRWQHGLKPRETDCGQRRQRWPTLPRW